MPKLHAPVILLAGFGAFPGVPINPSEQLIRSFDDEHYAGFARLGCLILPVEWGRSWEVLEARIRDDQPDAVVVFGVAAAAERIRIEMTARNERSVAVPDAVGAFAETSRVTSGPATAPVDFPLQAVERRFSVADVDFEISHDAGRYLCNETLFHLCSCAAALGVRHYGFIHTPPIGIRAPRRSDQAGMEAPCSVFAFRDLRRAADALLVALADVLSCETSSSA